MEESENASKPTIDGSDRRRQRKLGETETTVSATEMAVSPAETAVSAAETAVSAAETFKMDVRSKSEAVARRPQQTDAQIGRFGSRIFRVR